MKRKIKTDVERKAIKKEQDKMYRLVNKEEIKEYKKKWYLNNKVKTIETNNINKIKPLFLFAWYNILVIVMLSK